MKFYARGDQLYPSPLRTAVTGQFPRFVGRELRPAVVGSTGKVTEPPAWPATAAPWECPDRGPVAMEIKREFGKCKTLGHEPPLWPADAETAALVGVEFVPVTVKDGVAIASGKPAKEGK
jgi:hypothetical protein